MEENITNGAQNTSEGEGKNTGAQAGGALAAGSGDGKEKPAQTGTDGAGQKASGGDEKRFSQTDLDRVVGERLAEEKRRQDEKAKQEKLREQGKLGELISQHEAKIASLETNAGLAARYAEALNGFIEAQVATWPAEVKAFDPGAADPLLRLDWSKKAAALAEKLAKLPTAGATEAGAGNRPVGQAAPAQQGTKTGTGYRFQQANDVAW